MKIVLETCESICYDVPANIRLMVERTREAAQAGAECICFGASFLQGIDALTWNVANDVHLAIKIYSVEMKILMETAKYYDIAIAFGFYEECYRSFYCSYVFIDNNGVIIDMYRSCCQDWRHPDADVNRYKGGPDFHAFMYKDKRFLSTLGNDLEDEGRLQQINEIEKDVILCPAVGFLSEEAWTNKQIQLASQYTKVNQKMLFVPTLSYQTAPYGCSLSIIDGKIEKNKIVEI